MSKKDTPTIKNLADFKESSQQKGTRFALSAKRLAAESGAKAIGCNWFEVPPGKQAFPNHYHCAVEEAIFILEGQATVRIGSQTHQVKKHDFVVFPPGPEHSHSLQNTGSTKVSYLCLSSKASVDVVGYPDAGKIGVFAAPQGDGNHEGWFSKFVKDEDSLDYYDGEDTGE